MKDNKFSPTTCCHDGKRTPFCGVRFFCFHSKKVLNPGVTQAAREFEIKPSPYPFS